jgi:tetratricopeptide (TPR) repeat protein
MADLRVDNSAHAGGWRLQWHQDGAAVGEPVEVPAHAANQLCYLGSTIAQVFEHRSPDGFARLPLLPVTALAQIGEQLRDLCCGPIAAHLTNDAGPHRLTVAGDVPAALNLPWELLPVGGRGERLGCHKQWGVFRAPAGAPSPPPVRRGRPLRILFLAAAPTDQDALDYEKEEEAILRATATLQGARLFTAELGSYDELDALLRQVRPHIVHLSGHGAVGPDGVGRFCFEDEAGHSDQRTAAELARLFGAHDVPCVFLNGCQTSQAAVAGMCQALVQAGLPLALGWAASVADERATAFAETFYHELLAGEPVPAAAALARLRIQRDGVHPTAPGRDEAQELTFLLPQLYAARPVEALFDPQGPQEAFQGAETHYNLLPAGIQGLCQGFVGRRREQQRLLPALRTGEILFLLLHGVGGQGKSTLATRLVDRLRGAGFDVRAVFSKRQEGETAASCATRAAADLVTEMSLAAFTLGQEQLGALLGDEGKPLALRLLLAADALAKLKCVLVLDNFEDVLEVGPDGAWRIADAGLVKFYARVQAQLATGEGGRLVVTSRYLPAGTRADLDPVCVVAGLNDFKEYEFLKLLKRDERVAQRIRENALPIKLLQRLYAFAGGTPRFLERLRTLLRTFPAADLEAALDAGRGKLVEERDQYLEEHFGPKLFGLLSSAAQALLGRLGLSPLPLPAEALAVLTGLNAEALDATMRQGVEFGLLQVFEEADLPTLYLPHGVWRGWLAGQLTGDERTAAHGVLSGFWRGVYEEDREREMRVSVLDGLQACRSHGKHGGNGELWQWASVRLARLWERIAEWRAARAVLAEIPEAERDAAVWHNLATLDLNEGDYAAAREKFGKSLAIEQQIGDRRGEAATWHQLATIDVREGVYAAAREKFGKSLAIEQQIGNRAGEAAAWHNLASIDLNEGDYAAAREKFGTALRMCQQIGGRRGEAATWHNLATIDLNEEDYAAAREKFGKSLAIMQQIGARAGEAATWFQLASIDLNEGDYPTARKKLDKSLAIMQQIGDRAGEAAAWHNLATIDLNEGDYAAAREQLGKALAMHQQIGNRTGEAAAWHSLAFIDMHEGNYAAAREKLAKALAMREQVGDRAGEAATWHQLATIELIEGAHAAAREKCAKALAMRQQIGDRAGEAATFYQLGSVAAAENQPIPGAKLVGVCFLIDQAIGHSDTEEALQAFLSLCERLGLTEPQVRALLKEITESYQRDRGVSLLKEAFPDWE